MSTSYGVVERPAHHCGDDLVGLVRWRFLDTGSRDIEKVYVFGTGGSSTSFVYEVLLLLLQA